MNVRVPRIFHATLGNIHHAAFWLATFTIFSAFLGLIRDRFLASIFGASRELDMYYAAFRVPDILYTVLLFFTASTAIIPIFLEAQNDSKERSWRLLNSLIISFTIFAFVGIGASFIGMPFFVKFLFPGFLPSEQASVAALSRILLVSTFLLGLSNVFSSVTQAFRRFFAYALSPILYNVGIIIGIIVFLPRFGLLGLAFGVVIGAFFHLAVQFPSLHNIKISFVFGSIRNYDFWRVISLSLPRTLGLAITQIVSTIFTGIASSLAVGSIAVFTFASNLETIPVTLIGLSYSVAAFPNLAELSLRGSRSEFQEHFSIAFRHILFWTMPFVALLLVLRAQIVRVILGAGAFSWADTRLTAASLFLLSLAVVFQSLFMLFIRAFYAEGQTTRPVLINILSAFFSVASAFWFVQLFENNDRFIGFVKLILKLNGIGDIRVLALPLGILIGSALNFIFLFFVFRIVFGWFPTHGIFGALGNIFVSSVFAGGAAYGGLQIFARIFDLTTFVGIFAQGLFAGLAGIIVWIIILWILRSRELEEIYLGMRHILWREHVPAPEPEKLP